MPISRRISDRISQNSRQQDRVIRQRQEKPSIKPAIARGERDRDTGLYDVADPRGGEDKPAIKANNARLIDGDLVRFHNDGVRLVIDGPNAGDADPNAIAVSGLARNPDSLEGKVGKFFNCRGYLNGQIFNCPEEDGFPRGIIFLTHTVFNSSTGGGDVSYGNQNRFAETLFDFFTNSQGATVFGIGAQLIEDDEYLSRNHTGLTDVTLETAPPGSIWITGLDFPFGEFGADQVAQVKQFASTRGAVIVQLTSSSTAEDAIAEIEEYLSILGFGDLFTVSKKLRTAPTDSLCFNDPSAPFENNDFEGYFGVLNYAIVEWQAYTWQRDSSNPIWSQLARARFPQDLANNYQEGFITGMQIIDPDVGLVFEPSIIENFNPVTTTAGQPSAYTIDITGDLTYYPITRLYSSARIYDESIGLQCELSYLSGIYIPPSGIPL